MKSRFLARKFIRTSVSSVRAVRNRKPVEARGVLGPMQPPDDPEIRDVWADNMEAEFHIIREIVVKYPYIGMVRAVELSRPDSATRGSSEARLCVERLSHS